MADSDNHNNHVSFMVDARGGGIRGTRHSGLRMVIPPGTASMPTRITCRMIEKEKLLHPPLLNEGEALANRILEMEPPGTKFLGPFIIEVPHFASLMEREREIQILRSDNDEKWYEHPMIATEDAVNEAMGGTMEGGEPISSMLKCGGEEELAAKRVTRILTADLPQYFAIVTRVRVESQWIGEEGGVISSKVIPQVQAVFPQGALNKKVKVGLQAQSVSPDLISKMFGNRVACSPIVTVEPRRRKFHKYVTLTIPAPKTAQKGMKNQCPNENSSLRLLWSITGEHNPAIWEDITHYTTLQFVNDCVFFTTSVSARPFIIEVPHFASLMEREREVQILRSDNGEKWYEHPMIATEDAVNEAMRGTMEDGEPVSSMLKFEEEDELAAKRVTMILTADLPQYFAIVTRVRVENQWIGEEGGVISSKVIPQVQAVFPQGALNKKVKVGLQAQSVSQDLISKMFGNRVACSPIVTVEPRRRKFHKYVTLTIPAPKTAQKGMKNHYPNENSSLRLLWSITGEHNPAIWEDITQYTTLQFVNDCVFFTTSVSARFWLMDCQNTQECVRMATELYKEAITEIANG